MKVQLLTFPDCPNADAAREFLRRVLASSGIRGPIQEVNTTAPETAEHLRGWGSPTILINGVDIEGLHSPGTASCRVYRDSDGALRGIPSEAIILDAMKRAGTS
jgi:mercuric ion transport protein